MAADPGVRRDEIRGMDCLNIGRHDDTDFPE